MDVRTMYRTLENDLHRFARSIARHRQEADDLVQLALEKALANPGIAGLPVHKQRAWFFRVMKNQLIDERRREKRVTGWEEEYDFPIREQALSPVEVTDLLSSLSDEQRDIVFKRYWIGLTSQEIGSQLGLPPATVRYKLSRAVKQLRKKLEE
ncbi:RNA polymerase sigma factor [Alteribacter natronophilus]|uniref:RNA polymerase sigma factor n=1 Tax=Alteribacter natronophilus TaxID=2583810 RepID=UPI00110F1C37|nr:RNA polymerase sigma factor [Alteribacter natronophilus]TMW70521.1 RNA polymerase sigma factor [Alteribacter natronophilus]